MNILELILEIITLLNGSVNLISNSKIAEAQKMIQVALDSLSTVNDQILNANLTGGDISDADLDIDTTAMINSIKQLNEFIDNYTGN
ncbi:MAG: hypothetical protein ACPLX8_01065 [Nanopusillaceae archaeon]